MKHEPPHPPSRTRLRLLGASAAACLLAPSIVAGDVLRVGPTQPYPNVTAALSSAHSGDLVLVDPGSYPPFDVSAGISVSIVAAADSFTVTATPLVPEIVVQGVPCGEVVTIIGAHIAYDDPQAPAVYVHDNEGAVRFSRLRVDQTGDLYGAIVSASVEVLRTDTFHLIDSLIWPPVPGVNGDTTRATCTGIPNNGISGLELCDSAGAIQNSKIRGYRNDHTTAGYGGDGLRVCGLQLSGSCGDDGVSVWLLEDYAGGAYTANFYGENGKIGGHAVHQINSQPVNNRIESCGGPGSPAYNRGFGTVTPGGFYGINNDNGQVVLGNGLILWRGINHCGLAQQNENSLTSSKVPYGGTLNVRLRTTLARRYIVVYSDSSLYRRRIGRLAGRGLFDPTRVLAFSSGTTAPDTVTNLSVAIPSVPALAGIQLTVQTVTGRVGEPFDSLSSPAIAVIVAP